MEAPKYVMRPPKITVITQDEYLTIQSFNHTVHKTGMQLYNPNLSMTSFHVLHQILPANMCCSWSNFTESRKSGFFTGGTLQVTLRKAQDESNKINTKIGEYIMCAVKGIPPCYLKILHKLL